MLNPLTPSSSPRPPARALSRRFRSALLLGLFTGAAFVGGATWGAASSHATTPDESPYAFVGQFARVLVQVENEYVEPVDRGKLLKGAIKGMVEGLDPHSSYMTPEDFESFQNETEGQFGGVGIVVDVKADQLTVVAPIEGSPAARAGVKSGDRIVSVDGEDIEHVSLDKMVQRMRGPTGSHVKLFVMRKDIKEPLVFDLVREVVHVPSVSSRLLDGGVAYIRVKQFQEHTHQELVAAVARLRARGTLTGVILDLRNDPGGLVDQAAEIADELLVHGTIYTIRHRGEVIDEVKARPGGALSTLPAVVLVNEWSASASELVAGALQDHQRATIVGANTFGKGSVQTIIPLPGHAGLRLTTARYYTPNGRSLQAEGVHPDVLIESKQSDDEKALQLHERDLEGHLVAEASGGGNTGAASSTRPGVPVLREPPDAGTPPAPDENAVEGAEAIMVPVDPTKGTDFALRVGYQIVRHAPVDPGAPRPSASAPATLAKVTP
jgi:carboxyl-terminal processing protease